MKVPGDLQTTRIIIEMINTRIKKQMDSLIERILVGKYRHEDDQDWIERQGKRGSA